MNQEPLTDDELAETMAEVAFFHRLGPIFEKRNRRIPYLTRLVLVTVPRLIADLRASRAEAGLERALKNEYAERWEKAIAEVERLQKKVDQLSGRLQGLR